MHKHELRMLAPRPYDRWIDERPVKLGARVVGTVDVRNAAGVRLTGAAASIAHCLVCNWYELDAVRTMRREDDESALEALRDHLAERHSNELELERPAPSAWVAQLLGGAL